MTLEAGKDMDRRCLWGWLNEVYRNPTVAFNTYSDEQQIEFAHDALVLLKKQEAKTGHWNGPECSCCHAILERRWRFEYCPHCGAKMELDV